MDNSPNKRSWKDDDVVSELLLSLSPSTPGKKSKVESDYFEGSQTPIPTIFSTVGSTPIVDRPFGDHFFSPTRGIMSPMMTLSQSDSQNVPSSRDWAIPAGEVNQLADGFTFSERLASPTPKARFKKAMLDDAIGQVKFPEFGQTDCAALVEKGLECVRQRIGNQSSSSSSSGWEAFPAEPASSYSQSTSHRRKQQMPSSFLSTSSSVFGASDSPSIFASATSPMLSFSKPLLGGSSGPLSALSSPSPFDGVGELHRRSFESGVGDDDDEPELDWGGLVGDMSSPLGMSKHAALMGAKASLNSRQKMVDLDKFYSDRVNNFDKLVASGAAAGGGESHTLRRGAFPLSNTDVPIDGGASEDKEGAGPDEGDGDDDDSPDAAALHSQPSSDGAQQGQARPKAKASANNGGRPLGRPKGSLGKAKKALRDTPSPLQGEPVVLPPKIKKLTNKGSTSGLLPVASRSMDSLDGPSAPTSSNASTGVTPALGAMLHLNKSHTPPSQALSDSTSPVEAIGLGEESQGGDGGGGPAAAAAAGAAREAPLGNSKACVDEAMEIAGDGKGPNTKPTIKSEGADLRAAAGAASAAAGGGGGGGRMALETAVAANTKSPDNRELWMSPQTSHESPFVSPPSGLTSVSCSCRRSRCLKLYCDCFRASQYCDGCNCNQCANSLATDDVRVQARVAILERNPDAFKPRVDPKSSSKSHMSGCHCKKSACLKKYCECFTGKVPCGPKCRCMDCKNLPNIYGEGGIAVASSLLTTMAMASSSADALGGASQHSHSMQTQRAATGAGGDVGAGVGAQSKGSLSSQSGDVGGERSAASASRSTGRSPSFDVMQGVNSERSHGQGLGQSQGVDRDGDGGRGSDEGASSSSARMSVDDDGANRDTSRSSADREASSMAMGAAMSPPATFRSRSANGGWKTTTPLSSISGQKQWGSASAGGGSAPGSCLSVSAEGVVRVDPNFLDDDWANNEEISFPGAGRLQHSGRNAFDAISTSSSATGGGTAYEGDGPRTPPPKVRSPALLRAKSTSSVPSRTNGAFGPYMGSPQQTSALGNTSIGSIGILRSPSSRKKDPMNKSSKGFGGGGAGGGEGGRSLQDADALALESPLKTLVDYVTESDAVEQAEAVARESLMSLSPKLTIRKTPPADIPSLALFARGQTATPADTSLSSSLSSSSSSSSTAPGAGKSEFDDGVNGDHDEEGERAP